MHCHRQWSPLGSPYKSTGCDTVAARLWSPLSFYVGLSLWISNAEQDVFIPLRCAMLQPSPGWGDLYEPPLHISSIMPRMCVSDHDPKHCTAIEFSHFFILLCLCLPLTYCQCGNLQHPATLPPAASWCVIVWVMSWINMLMYKELNVGSKWDRQFTCVWKEGSSERNDRVTQLKTKNKTSCIHKDLFLYIFHSNV